MGVLARAGRQVLARIIQVLLRLMHVNEVQTKLEDCLDQAQIHRLSHKIFPNSIYESIKANIDIVSKCNGYISFVKHTTDLFQIPLSYVYQPEIKYKLNSIVYKLYHLKSVFNQLTSQEQQLWKTFPLCDIYKLLTGDPYTPPDYNEYVRFRRIVQPLPQAQPQLQPQVPQPNQAQPQPAANQQNPWPASTPTSKKRGRPPGSKNKPKDPLTHTTHPNAIQKFL
jgi:hypothetical protein